MFLWNFMEFWFYSMSPIIGIELNGLFFPRSNPFPFRVIFFYLFHVFDPMFQQMVEMVELIDDPFLI